jgi:hypothetical protein
VTERRYGWPFLPTNEDGLWDFDRASEFDLQPLYVPAEGVRWRAEIAAMPRGTALEQEAHDLASAAATRSEDLTAFMLDRAPSMYRLLGMLTSPHLSLEEALSIVDGAERILKAINDDIDSYG